MLSLTRVSAWQASTYYAADDYYLQEKGEWQGELATKLGFSGVIKEEDFSSLIEGKDPKGRFQIQSGGKEYLHTAGVDLTFSAPKSVSIAGLVLDDKRILEAHDKAVTDTLAYIEKNYTDVRIKKDGKVDIQETGNMIATKFQHITSRELDPQLHTHCLVMNITQKENGDIRAMDYKDFFTEKLFLGQVYRSELAANLKEIGYEIKSDNKGLFEIGGIDARLMREFSTRSEQIKEKMVELREKFPNMNESKLKEHAALDTRVSKKEVNINDVKQHWNNQLGDFGYRIGTSEANIQQRSSDGQELVTKDAQSLIRNAVEIATEHEAVAKKSDILRIASKLGIGEFRILELEKALAKDKGVIKLGKNEYTTPEIAAIERQIIDSVKQGREQLPAVLTDKGVKTEVIRYEMEHNFKLTTGQKEAVEHILTSKDRVVAIQGDAGTGKTTMLDVVRIIGEKEKQEIVGLSFTGKAASEIQEASKIQSQTISSFLHSDISLKGKLVVIDEASMLSIKDMKSLLNRCDTDTRLVLIGDTKQLQSIGQGKIFSSLQEKKTISVVRMSEVQRQKNEEYKDVVNKLGAKQIDEALNTLNLGGRINQIVERDTRLDAITKEYLANPKSTIIVTATNKDREELNQRIRNELISNGNVKKGGMTVLTRENKSLIGEEKNYAHSYSVGNLIVANEVGIIGKSGAEARVIGVDTNRHLLQVKSGGKTLEVDLKRDGQKLQVYTEKNSDFAKGDKILFLKNDTGLKVKNGQTGFIKSVSNDGNLAVKLDNGRDLSVNPRFQYNYISHGYALTDYKSQGQTEKHVIYHADTQKIINYNQAYVAITRGKESVKIYTNDKIGLGEAIKQEQVKTTTLDYNLVKTNITPVSKRNELEKAVASSKGKSSGIER